MKAAGNVLQQFFNPTPLVGYPELSEFLGFNAHVKHENHLPTGSFKVRGGLNFMHQLEYEQKRRGVITATRGNHGASIAYAGKMFSVHTTIVVPHGNNPEKNSAIRAYGAELIEHGADFDEARQFCEQLQAERGLYYVNPCTEPSLFHGIGTYALEIFDKLSDADVIIVPIGGGSGCCGTITVSRKINPKTKIIGVQAENAPAFYLSWNAGKVIETDSCETIAEGLATRMPFSLPLTILKDTMHQIVLLSEEEIREGVRMALRYTHNLAEPSGATTLAAAQKLQSELANQNVVMVMSGGNIDTPTLRTILK